MRTTVLAVLAVAAVSSWSCSAEDRSGRDVPGRVLDIVESEYVIDMPDTVPSGVATLRVRNAGSLAHSLEIEGPNVHEALDHALEPGEEAEMQVALAPGEYYVFCPVGDHEERGMSHLLHVVPAP